MGSHHPISSSGFFQQSEKNGVVLGGGQRVGQVKRDKLALSSASQTLL